MQIFALDINPTVAARQHCDKHVVKMILEYAQLLSVAHRVLDGERIVLVKPNSKKQTLMLLPGEKAVLNEAGTKYIIDKPKLYRTTHVSHPCAVWARGNAENYMWLFKLLEACLMEYERRYNRVHLVKRKKLPELLVTPPKNIPHGKMTPFPLAMPDVYKVSHDPIISYQAFYIGDKASFAKWTDTELPKWFEQGVQGKYDISSFIRTR